LNYPLQTPGRKSPLPANLRPYAFQTPTKSRIFQTEGHLDLSAKNTPMH
jgi:hypothetical protein